MVIHDLANLKELHNPLKGKLSKVAEYFIKFYGEQYREKIINTFKNIEFVFVDPVTKEGDTSFQIYFDGIRDKIFAQLGLQLSTKGIKIVDKSEFLKNIKGVERLSKTIKPTDCEQVINLLCAFEVRHLPENLQLLADKTVTPRDFALLINEEPIKNDLLKFFSTVNSVYSGKIQENFEQLDADQKRLGFDKKVDYKSVTNIYDVQIINLICDVITTQFSIPKTRENYLKIYNYLPEYLLFLKNENVNEINNERLEGMFETFYQLSSEKEEHLQLREQLDKGGLDLNSPYFKSLQSYYSVFMKRLLKITRERDETILSLFDDTRKVMQYIKENNLVFDEQVIETLNSYKFGRFDKNVFVDSSGACVYTIGRDKPHMQKSFIILNSFMLLQDRTLFHELNHALQISTIPEGENSVKMKIGVPSAKIEFLQDGEKIDKTFEEKATMFNEVLNDYLTEKIFEPARGQIRIGREIESEEGYYMLAFAFLKKFFDKNLDILKECAMSEDPFSYIKYFDKQDLVKLINMTDNLMEDIRKRQDIYGDFIKQKFLMDLKSNRNIPTEELKEEDFEGECKMFVRYLKEFDKLAEEIKPLSKQENSEKQNDSDENDDWRDK